MKQITLEIPDRDYEIISKVAELRGKSIQEYTYENAKVGIEGDLQDNSGSLMGFETVKGSYMHIFEDSEA